jgi:hypothetical protein
MNAIAERTRDKSISIRKDSDCGRLPAATIRTFLSQILFLQEGPSDEG